MIPPLEKWKRNIKSAADRSLTHHEELKERYRVPGEECPTPHFAVFGA